MTNTIVVVGGGVSGLTSAYLLSKSKANTVTVVAKHMPGDYDIEYASPIAGANVLPMNPDADSRWERRTWPEFEWLCKNVPEAGFHFKNVRIFRKNKDLDPDTASMPMDPLFDMNAWYRHMMPDYRELEASELPPGQDSGCSFTSVCLNTPMYLSWLVGQCLRNGVVLKRGVLSDLADARSLSHAGRPADIVVNATGLGSLRLGGVKDTTMAPARGQIVLVRNDRPSMLVTSSTDDGSGEVLYVMHRAAGGGTVIGGTYDLGNWESQPCPNIAARIMARAVRLDPELAGGKGVTGLDVIRHAVGLRPYRKGGVRIERETLRDEAAGGGSVEVVHNYGHAGWGYQGSFGCAERVVELVNEIRAAKGEDLSKEPKLFHYDASAAPKLQLDAVKISTTTDHYSAQHFSRRDSLLRDSRFPGNIRRDDREPMEVKRMPAAPAAAPRQAPAHVRALTFVLDVACGRHALSPLIPVALWLADAVLTCLVIWKIPYTEIDWVAYMEQIKQFVHGERDYTKIKGGTGPLVYPAAHVYTYTGLYYLTDEGENILLAQQLFAVLYMATLGLVMLCYWKAKVPPYVFPLLILSKRLHSVFVLRCFNDCFAAFFLWLAIYAFQRRLWALGAMAYTWGLGIKMSLLLVLPAVAAVLLHARGFSGALSLAWLMAQVQVVIALPFAATNTNGYLARAFELSRQFKYEWTVNWRMAGEATFLSRGFALALLGLHAATLALFLSTRWMRPANKSLRVMVPAWLRFRAGLTPDEEHRASRRVTPDFVMTSILAANVVGLLFARSLHYQFYAYLAWSTPFLLWRALPSAALVYPLWLLQEWAWNVFPSTSESSTAAVAVMATTVLAVYVGTRNDGIVVKKPAAKKQ